MPELARGLPRARCPGPAASGSRGKPLSDAQLETKLTDLANWSGFKGDTATGGNKPATLETGLVVNVPLFVSIGDVLKVDTRTGQYLERA